MSEATNRQLIRTTTRVAFLVALLTFCVIPTVFFLTALTQTQARLTDDAHHNADRIAKLIYSDPRHWRFQELRLREMLTADAHHAHRMRRGLFDLDGNRIVAVGPALGPLRLTGKAEVGDGRNTIATVAVSESLVPLLSQTGGIALLSLALAGAVFFAMKTLPLRALRATVANLERSEAALRDAKEQADLANKAKSEFLANMSHELRTPLNAVIGFSEIIDSETLGPIGNVRYRGYAANIRDSGRHLLDLIDDILDLSKIEAGKGELHEEAVDVPALVRSVRMLVGPRAAGANIELDCALAAGLPALHADERRLKQMLVNLLTNAVKFTPSGGTVTLEVACPADDGFIFRVVDTGIGLAADDIPKALSTFCQVDAAHIRQHEGAGLGLPLTRSLVELHGGTLTLESELGVGTTVTLHFPAARTRRPPRDTAPQPLATGTTG